eukprot:gnl/TRDRNA2_/TRDRNA2_173727_c11_seq15.p1 gnl/TRDRNA2_/TRDRNA2_173727_c11~~gnl/TRDRNA2_/TRDRNA2_173727_c11_seq15.p1  ORF type:complete len:627 (-),score=157.07 gnl/TRDRNA2_/TRDRNA2_173727_c11_seq15:205-2085(-)
MIQLGMGSDPGGDDAVEGGAGGGSGPGSKPGSSQGKRPPLPVRVENLEVAHEELKEELVEQLGITLPLGAARTGTASPDSPKTPKSDKGGGAAGLNSRMTAVEERLAEIAERLDGGAAPKQSGSGRQSPKGGKSPKVRQSPETPEARIDLLEDKMDEVSVAIGVSPEELAEAARAESRGTLAGRVLLREQADACSPRIAGAIAGNADQISQLEEKFSKQLKGLEVRLRDLEGPELADGAAAKGKGSDNLQWLENRVNQLVIEDDAYKGSAPKANRMKKDRQDEAADALQTAFIDLKHDHSELKQKLKKVINDLNHVRQQLAEGAPPVRMGSGGGDGIMGDGGTGGAGAGIAAERAETAAEAAEAACIEARRLKEELQDILQAVEVPNLDAGVDAMLDDCMMQPERERLNSAGSQGVGRMGEGTPDPSEEVKAVLENSMNIIDNRINALEEQLDKASVIMPQSEVITSLKAVTGDVRRCLQRCELLFQLPEVKAFVKRFQKSLAVNAVLHERWLGPGAGKRSQDDDGRPRSTQSDEGQLDRGEHSRSVPDLTERTRARRSDGMSSTARHGKGGGKGPAKKPFRTVVDWCRPHTPLNVEPARKTFGFQEDEPTGKPPKDDHRLPQLKR